MDAVGEQRVLLGVDVIGSAGNPGEDLHRVAEAWRSILQGSLASAGLGFGDVLEFEQQGDGALLTLPHTVLGRVVDMSQRMHELAVAHNRERRPEVRLRMAVETGPVPDRQQTYLRAKIDRARLLESAAFKALMERCHTEPGGGAHTGLIISDHAFRTAFGGDHTVLVRDTEFAEITVAVKEYEAKAWVRVPGFDARSLRTFLDQATTPRPEQAHDDLRATNGGVHNQVNGVMRGVQAGIIHGGVRFGPDER
jgi:hypothetical protein